MISLFDISLLIQITLSGIIFATITYQRIHNQVKPLNWLVFVFGFAFFRSVIELLTINLTFPLNEIHFIPYSLAMLTFFLFAEYTNAISPDFKKVALVFSLFGGFMFFFLLAIMAGPDQTVEFWPLNHISTFYELPFDLLQLVIFSYITVIFFKMSRLANTTSLKRSTVLAMIAMVIMVVAAIIEIAEFFLPVDISAAITTVPAFLLFFIVYMLNPTFAYSSPVKVYRVMVVSEDGPAVMNLDIEARSEIDDEARDAQLVGGVANSINNLLREITTESEDNIENIKLGKTSFMFVRYRSLFAIIEAERSTRVLRRALKDFTADFYETFIDRIKEHYQITRGEELDPLISRYFPFYAID